MEQLQVSVRLIAGTLAAIFFIVIVVERRGEHNPSATEYALMAGIVILALVALNPPLSADIAQFLWGMAHMATLPHPVTIPR